ncbi:MAG TPA: J domain-containing protein [Telluria sp.]
MASFQTHYDILQIARNASDVVIRAAYRGLAQQHHPDKQARNAPNADDFMQVINAAYDVLSDSVKRRAYDEWIGQASIGSFVDYRTMPFDWFIYPNIKRLVHLALISLVFVVGAVLLLMANTMQASWWDEPVTNGLTAAWVVFFGFAALSYLNRLVNPSPSVVVNEFGVQVATFDGAMLRWSEIDDVHIENRNDNRFLAISPTHPDILMRRQSLWGRICTRLHAARTRKPAAIFIPEALLNAPLEELVGEMRSRHPKRQ